MIPPVSALVAVPGATLPKTAAPKPVLTGGADSLTSFFRLSATRTGAAPASVAFAIRRRGGNWQRIAIDDSAPYRAFVTPSRFKKKEHVDGVAVTSGVGGSFN